MHVSTLLVPVCSLLPRDPLPTLTAYTIPEQTRPRLQRRGFVRPRNLEEKAPGAAPDATTNGGAPLGEAVEKPGSGSCGQSAYTASAGERSQFTVAWLWTGNHVLGVSEHLGFQQAS